MIQARQQYRAVLVSLAEAAAENARLREQARQLAKSQPPSRNTHAVNWG